MKVALKIAAASLMALGATTVGVAAQEGQFIRKGKEQIVLRLAEDRLFCTRVSDGFEMCNGMTKQQDGTWKGKNMRHPAMPKFMKFNGTVTFTATGLNIKGCALGICKAENWTK